MGAPDVINDIKVIFFILNTIVGLLAGLLSISVGVSFAVISQGPSNGAVAVTIAPIIVGLIVLGVAALGYAGAIHQNSIMLFVYTGVMSLAGVADIFKIATLERRNGGELNLLIPVITHLGLVVLAIILAVILAVKSRNQCNQGKILSPPPAAYIPVA